MPPVLWLPPRTFALRTEHRLEGELRTADAASGTACRKNFGDRISLFRLTRRPFRAIRSGAVVPNASVTVKNNATGLQRTTTTSEDGIFTVPQLPTGTYTITIQATSGFKKAEVTAVKVDVGILDICLPSSSDITSS